jgi:PAS domain-containing protein
MSTEGNRHKEALTSSEQELRLLVEAIPALVWRAGPEGDFEYVKLKLCSSLKVGPMTRARLDARVP